MIPITLQLKNFLSYGPQLQTIEFGPHPLICLSGKNGHGKSALLDAITWAIWGAARKVTNASKADEGLLRLGQTSMQVILDFAFNGRCYRIKREFSLAPSKAYANLEFGIIDPETKAVTPLTDKTIRATQEKIQSVIGLDYESFINSAFLRQGNSNEFSHKSPKDRKEILASILGLGNYEELRRHALEKIKKFQDEKEALAAHQQRLQQTTEQSSTLATQIASVEQQLTHIGTQEQQATLDQHKLDQQKELFTTQQQAAKLIAMQRQTLEQTMAQQIEKLQTIRMQWRTIHSKLLHAPNVAALENDKQELSRLIAEQQAVLQKQLQLKEQYLAAKEAEQRIRNDLHRVHTTLYQEKKSAVDRIENQRAILNEQFKTIHQTTQQLTAQLQQLNQELHHAQQRQLELDQQLIPLPALEQQFEKRKLFYQKYIALGNVLVSQKAHVIQKQKLTQDTESPSCPLCEQNLSAARKRFLKTKFSDEEKLYVHRIARITTIVSKLKQLLTEQHALRETLTKANQERALVTQKIKELTKQQEISHKHAQELADGLQLKQAEITALEKEVARAQQEAQQIPTFENWLLTQEPYQQTHQQLAHRADQFQKISFDPEQLNKLQTKLQATEQQLREYHTVLQESLKQRQRQEQFKELVVQLKQNKKQHSDLATQERAANPKAEDLANLDELYKKLVSHRHQLTASKEQLLQERGRLEAACQQIATIQKEIPVIAAQITQTLEQIEDYQLISTALGKDGIQALLIEEAIPEIESEANRLLAKLTDNQAQVFIESIRDLKKGGSKETLDIKISDALGIRPYELFSGGEAFRIDFALRIAIAKLLARRAGTSLQTLIIDEGFGSQDEEGLTHIMDALYKIQDDFAKIIIVSHLPTMKDQFPVHFVIEKGPHGSRVRTVEQG